MTLRERKEILVSDWEKNFEKKVTDSIKQIGMKKFWDEKTSWAEAAEMLTKAATLDLLDSMGVLEDIVSLTKGKAPGKVVIVVGDAAYEYEPENDPKFLVRRGDYIYPDKFDNIEDAEAFIKDTCCETEYTRNSFNILEEKN